MGRDGVERRAECRRRHPLSTMLVTGKVRCDTCDKGFKKNSHLAGCGRANGGMACFLVCKSCLVEQFQNEEALA